MSCNATTQILSRELARLCRLSSIDVDRDILRLINEQEKALGPSLTRAQFSQLTDAAFKTNNVVLSPPTVSASPSNEEWWVEDLSSHPSQPDRFEVRRIQNAVRYRLQVCMLSHTVACLVFEGTTSIEQFY